MRKREYRRVVLGGLAFALLVGGWTWGAQAPATKLSAGDMKALSQRFQKELWPLLTRPESNCVTCHTDRNPSQLHLPKDADAAFKYLLGNNFFDPDSPTGLLARINAPKERRMPPAPFAAWTEREIATLHTFVTDLARRMNKDAPHADEQFPLELLSPFTGKPKNAGRDNTFITFYQLRRKIKAIFGDDWVRNGKDLFNENIALFGGADFVRRFNESSKASATFLSGVDLMARDVATQAYIHSSGPFAGRADNLPSPLSLQAPDATYRREINRLYQRLLFRSATEKELQDAFRFIQDVYRQQEKLALQPQELRFELTVKDADGLQTTQPFTMQVTNDRCGLYQEFLDQTKTSENVAVKHKLKRVFTFKANDDGQQFQISNEATSGNVSIAGIELSGPVTKTIMVNDPSVQVLGAWRLNTNDGLTSYEDGNENKGGSSVIIPIRVPQDGKYELSVIWRRNDGGARPDGRGRFRPPVANARRVLVEVLSHDPTQHAVEPPPPIPPQGEAHFTIDQTVDNVPFQDLNTVFQFGPNDGVEIHNAGTKRTVVADAVQFAHSQSGAKFLVRGTEAEGNERWEVFDPGAFRPYNTVGPKLLSDGNQRKGELKLLYKPSVRQEAWKPEAFYRVQIISPGKAGNETQTPVIVRARASSPIVQLTYPRRVHVGGAVTMDASATYNLQRSPLQFRWTQTGGPRVQLSDPHAPRVTFIAPAMSPQQAAWEGLCRALMRHPDFLFTRPPSLATVKDPRERRRLQLVKIAQDLVGRTPTETERKKLDGGAPLSALVDDYLNSQEFKDFYFHRVRLTLESHGTEEEDEPSRLWCYIAFNDRPFKEILTADYTVDKNFQKQSRPAYHGKTGLLTMKGFIKGKPGLPHFNYAAMVCEKFLGYVFEVPPSIVEMREGITAVATTSPTSTCYSCHKILTPLAYQRLRWTDDGEYREKDEDGKPIDDSDRNLVPSYPFKGSGMEAFATQAVHKERFIRTMIQTHFVFYFGREMRYNEDERGLYKRLWDSVHRNNFSIRKLIKAIVLSPEYLSASSVTHAPMKPSEAKVARR
ncbi:MAG: hypothetical protein NZT92_01000 [Abditibacteriales bacterium]|nr:hypothetical protein [Abditibacteriales bacterium]MDW8364378.1 hypothetical protein [Abditibacteriales bacterium]